MQNIYDYISNIRNKVCNGIYPNYNEVNQINTICMELLNYTSLDINQLDVLRMILDICDIVYNNTTLNLLPLDDGVYDLLVEKYKQYRPFEVCALPVNFLEEYLPPNDQFRDTNPINPILFLDEERADDSLFINEEGLLRNIPIEQFKPMPYYTIEDNATSIDKITRNVSHKYPKLVGTLDKCKFVLNKEAKDRDGFLLDDPTVKIFERDFIGLHIAQGYISPYQPIDLVAELKYDGVSIEAEVTNVILSARSRGDTGNDIAADYTPIFQGMEFPYVPKELASEEPFGIKFEAIITRDNLERLNQLRGVNYVNPRVAIIGLLGASDAYKYRNFITLIPLATSLDLDRVTELEFLNKYYNQGELNRYSVIHGSNYTDAIFQVYKFVEEAQMMRDMIPYMYDGVVVSYIDPNLISRLGRVGAINKYTTAIKFPPMKRQTVFTGYSFTVGQNGVITPLLHYNPVEFYGSIHTKSSGHSYARFLELGLRLGDIIDVEYTNDVMPYATKTVCSQNEYNSNPVIEFPKYCPCCGSPLKFTNKQAVCENLRCDERVYGRVTNMVKVLGIKDFSEKRIRQLHITSLKGLASLKLEYLESILGHTNGKKLYDRIQDTIFNKNLKEYVLVSCLGFANISNLTWKKIFTKIHLSEFCNLVFAKEYIVLRDKLRSIRDIGPSTVVTILEYLEMDEVKNDLALILGLYNAGLVTLSYKPIETNSLGVIRFSGVRDQSLEIQLSELGYDCSGTAGVTKKTDILIVPYPGYMSTKVTKLRPGAVIMPIDEARQRFGLL